MVKEVAMDVFGRFLGASGNADRQQKVQDLERSGLENLRAGNLLQAKADLQKAVGLDSKNATLRGHLATVLARLDMYTDADKEFQTAIKLSPVNEGLRHAHGQLLERLLRPDEAAAEYGLACTLDSRSTQSLVALALLEAKRDESEKAESYLLVAFERDANDPQAWTVLAEIHLARLLEEQGNLDRGVEMLTNAYHGSPKDGGIQAALDKKMLRRNRVSQGIEVYRHLADLPPADQAFYRDSELSRLKSAGSDGSALPGSDQWLDVMYAWYSSLGGQSSAATSMLKADPQVQAAAVAAAGRSQALDPARADLAAGSRAAGSEEATKEREAPPAVVRPMSQVDLERNNAIGKLEFEVARDPNNSKLRRDLSILYLQAGRVADAKEQARQAESVMRQRHTEGRPAE
jgi:Flp pilus assembly protein TadD